MTLRGLIFISLLAVAAVGQSISLVYTAGVPDGLEETSGIEINNPNRIWSHNDSGGDAVLYGFDSGGTLFEMFEVNGAVNQDWEELAQGETGEFYIGDFGNNSHSRTNLRIYKIPNPDSLDLDSATAEVIYFNYPDQTEFPPPDESKNYDCEAMIAIGDSLHIFSKNWTSPFNGYTKHYSLSNEPGTYLANLQDSFDTGTLISTQGQITAADISPHGEVLALMSYRKLWLFSDFPGTDFFRGDVLEMDISTLTQIEGFCFISETEAYITDEEVTVGPITVGGNLYYVDLGDYLGVPLYSNRTPSSFDINASPNPFNGAVTINVKFSPCQGGDVRRTEGVNIEIFDVNGRRIETLRPSGTSGTGHSSLEKEGMEVPLLKGDLGGSFIWQPAPSLGSGVYLVRARVNGCVVTRRLVYLK